MSQEYKPSKLKSIIEPLEKFLLFSLTVNLLLIYFSIVQTQIIIVFNLIALAIVFFISAFLPPELFDSQEEADEHEQFGMLDLLATTIAPKVMWIGSSVSIFGLVMYITKPEIESYVKLAMIGGPSIILCLTIFGISMLSGIKLHKSNYKVLVRGIPLLLMNYYLLFETTHSW